MLLGLNVCTEQDEERCKLQMGSRWQRACKRCEKKKPGELHPWTGHLVRLRHLIKAGYPFAKNDLSYHEWLDLGLLNEVLDK